MKLLTLGNPKLAKGSAHGYLSAVLHLAPSNLSGTINVCARATAGCIAACLNLAGRGGIFKAGEDTNAIQRARIARTVRLVTDPFGFAVELRRDIYALERAAERVGLRPALRLNGTSDLCWIDLDGDIGKAWEARGIDAWDARGAIANVVWDASKRGVRFYDYTKRAGLASWYAERGFPMHITFSRAETLANKREASKAIARGENVAVVFSTRKGADLPATFDGVPVIDGDAHDLRFLDPAGVVVGLRAKGKAKRDASGFVVRV